VPGNNPAASAEWNFYADPLAASLVLQSGAPLMLVPLDATNHVPITQSFYKRLKADHAAPAAQFVYDGLTEEKSLIDSPGFEFWDSLTAAIWVDESLSTFQSRALAVEPETGHVIEQAGGPLVRYALTADRERFEQAFLDGVNAVWP
jgi:inosine-uridine nucleoside N-ribohydrolase